MSDKIKPHHLERKAILYVRQSSAYRRRWKIERLFAWLQNFRRLVVRYECHAENFLGMLHVLSDHVEEFRWVLASRAQGSTARPGRGQKTS